MKCGRCAELETVLVEAHKHIALTSSRRGLMGRIDDALGKAEPDEGLLEPAWCGRCGGTCKCD